MLLASGRCGRCEVRCYGWRIVVFTVLVVVSCLLRCRSRLDTPDALPVERHMPPPLCFRHARATMALTLLPCCVEAATNSRPLQEGKSSNRRSRVYDAVMMHARQHMIHKRVVTRVVAMLFVSADHPITPTFDFTEVLTFMMAV